MKKNIMFYIILAILVITCGGLLFVIYSNHSKCLDDATEKFKLEEKITQLESLVESLNSKLNHPIEEPEDNRECTFIRTLKFMSIIDYQGQVNEKYALFSAYQGSYSIMLRFEPDTNYQLEKDKNYEITFNGLVKDKEELKYYKIVSIKQTYKLGMNQIQESCQGE